MSKPRVIKVFPKSNMAIIWIDIWDAQSDTRAKDLINRYFNVRMYIATIRGANMNSGILQYKNCWKWGHSTFSCRIQGLKCVKCNRPHKLENHHEFGWYYKANEKTNPLCLETKKDKLYLHIFKCSNCWGKHQVDSTLCSFWKNRFNRKWHQKKYSKIYENRVNSIHLVMNRNFQK